MGIGYGLMLDNGKLKTRYEEGQQVYQLTTAMIEALRSKPDVEQRAIIAAHEQTARAEQQARKTRKEKKPDLDRMQSAERVAFKVKDRYDAALESEKDAVDERIAFTTGSYWDATRLRTRHGLKYLASTPAFVGIVLLYLFLLGYWLIVTGRMRNSQQHAGFFRNLMLIGLGFGIPLNVAAMLVTVHPAARGIDLLQGTSSGLFQLGQYVLSAGYLGTLVTLVNSLRWRKLVLWLAPLGRMALTNYLTHSIVLTTLFYGYGFGKFGHIARGPQMLIVVAIIALQLVFSRWWLQRCQYGPMEWVWRCLTYWQRQPLRMQR
jgi:uncharacterized protein